LHLIAIKSKVEYKNKPESKEQEKMGWNNDNETKQHFTTFKQTKMKASQ
jgi:hypothetical protein